MIRRLTQGVLLNAKRCYSSPRMTSNHLIWIDMEMSGLDVKKDRIMEIACVVTDKHLKVISSSPDYVIHQPDEVLNGMDEWCTRTHAQSGLTEASRQSKLSGEQVEEEVIKFLSQHVEAKQCPLAGNSVYMDKFFLMEYMPRLADFLHYRIVDVSTVKELCRRWNPKVFWAAPVKQLSHRALDDILESIEELKYYQKFMFTHSEEPL